VLLQELCDRLLGILDLGNETLFWKLVNDDSPTGSVVLEIGERVMTNENLVLFRLEILCFGNKLTVSA
jgi:hypothetical protein